MLLNFELDHPDEMEAFATFLTATAKSRRERPAPIGLFGLDRAANSLWQTGVDRAAKDSLTREAEAATPGADEPAEQTEAPKRTRRTKAEIEADKKATETVANLDPAVVAEAAAAGVNVQGPAEVDETADEPDKQVEEVKLTENDVRNSIIDLLNEAQKAFPDDADIRTKTLTPILKELGAPKISLIPATEYGKVAGILAKVRSAMEATLAEAA